MQIDKATDQSIDISGQMWRITQGVETAETDFTRKVQITGESNDIANRQLI